jgi:hypothetical protein
MRSIEDLSLRLPRWEVLGAVLGSTPARVCECVCVCVCVCASVYIIVYAYLVLPRASLASKPDKGRVDIHYVMCSSYWQPSNSTDQASALTNPRACGTKVLVFYVF